MSNKIQLTVFTLLVFVRCVVIFPIHCDLSDFLQPRVLDLNLLPEFPYKSFIFTAILNSHNELGSPVNELTALWPVI